MSTKFLLCYHATYFSSAEQSPRLIGYKVIMALRLYPVIRDLPARAGLEYMLQMSTTPADSFAHRASYRRSTLGCFVGRGDGYGLDSVACGNTRLGH